MNLTARQQAPSACREEARCPVASSLSAAQQHIAERVSIEHRGYITPCWVWQKCVNHHGYAVSTLPGRGWARVHRAAYEEYVGPIPAGLQLDHLCGVKPCCNPAHLEPVTLLENLDRYWSKRGVKVNGPRTKRPYIKKAPAPPKTHCRNGHEYTPENLFIGSDGARGCRTCRRAQKARFKLNHPDRVRAQQNRWRESHRLTSTDAGSLTSTLAT